MVKSDLSQVYRDYIACLNKQDWPRLEQFVHDEVCRNDQQIGLSGYRKMLERDFSEIPDLHFNIQLLISDPPYIASRLKFDCRPKSGPGRIDAANEWAALKNARYYGFYR